ncbi:FkbM family methyltransferase [Pedobacter yulinensis]|uniref:FkbM family methyltransferase n=1 Tax=Pedobacter yulinensis TaxID=2126353 RepID=A0A2T3HNJ8_9SPHI|nr:FkbM family methyltransferase [Pedobacter yulinensis]PST84024.1 FkbM family methyltransferase [Pedobacter yulinensis]
MKNTLSPLSLLNLAKLKVLLSLGFKGYLAEKGWFKAYETRSAIDERGMPIPWVTYSFIDFIRTRIRPSHDIFEFGSGNSTVFYARNARSVTAVEHDRPWYERSQALGLKNAEVLFFELEPDGTYCRSAAGKNYHIIIVDGRDRVNCCRQAVHSLTSDGVVVLDDSERPEYADAIAFLKSEGFKELPFTGMAPGVIVSKCTTVFYKSNNCLDI